MSPVRTTRRSATRPATMRGRELVGRAGAVGEGPQHGAAGLAVAALVRRLAACSRRPSRRPGRASGDPARCHAQLAGERALGAARRRPAHGGAEVHQHLVPRPAVAGRHERVGRRPGPRRSVSRSPATRASTRAMFVSTTATSRSKANASTARAVYGPMPGRAQQRVEVVGHRAAVALDHRRRRVVEVAGPPRVAEPLPARAARRRAAPPRTPPASGRRRRTPATSGSRAAPGSAAASPRRRGSPTDRGSPATAGRAAAARPRPARRRDRSDGRSTSSADVDACGVCQPVAPSGAGGAAPRSASRRRRSSPAPGSGARRTWRPRRRTTAPTCCRSPRRRASASLPRRRRRPAPRPCAMPTVGCPRHAGDRLRPGVDRRPRCAARRCATPS